MPNSTVTYLPRTYVFIPTTKKEPQRLADASRVINKCVRLHSTVTATHSTTYDLCHVQCVQMYSRTIIVIQIPCARDQRPCHIPHDY